MFKDISFKILTLSFLTFIYGQFSVSDINSMNDEEIKKLISGTNSPSLDQKEMNSDQVIDQEFEIKPKEVLVGFDANSNFEIDDEYYGYEYFIKEINFFDNAPSPGDYRLGSGDEIIISLWGETNIRESFTINKEGQIYYNSLGFINLSNKTIDEAESLLIKELSKIYSTLQNDSNVTNLTLELGKLKSLNIYFSGEVFSPGIQIVHPFSDIFVALIQAGGINKEGSLRNVKLIRDNEVIQVVDFYTFFNKGSKNFSNFKLIDGDIIHVPSIEKRVEIRGLVARPGFYEVIDNDTIEDVIEYAAGLDAKASSIIVLDTIVPISQRTSQDNIISSYNIDLKNSKKMKLNHGDLITIREVGKSDSKVQIFGRVKVPGAYSATNSTLKDILDYAGGFNDPVFRKTIRENEIIVLRKDASQFYSKEFTIPYQKSSSFKLQVDDKIFVYEDINYKNSFTFRVEGEVNKPGTYPLKKGTTLRDAIKLAGGLTELTTIDNVIVSQEFTEIDEFDVEATFIENVANVNFETELGINSVVKALPFENAVRVEGNVYNPGLVAYKKGLTLLSAVEQAGGYKPYSLLKRVYIKKANGQVVKPNIFNGRFKRLMPGDTVVVPLDPNPSEFDVTQFVADLSTTLANIAAILIVIDNNN